MDGLSDPPSHFSDYLASLLPVLSFGGVGSGNVFKSPSCAERPKFFI